MSNMRSIPFHCAASAALLLALSGCTATPRQHHLARGTADCLPGFMMSCDAERRGAAVQYANCQCVSHATVREFLQDR